MSLVEQLSENQLIIGFLPSETYAERTVQIAKELAAKGSVCYVTLNKTFESLKEIFQKKGIDTKNFVFVDAISGSFKETRVKVDQCYYVSSPDSLTEISIAISNALGDGCEFLIFDSISNLFIYNKSETMTKFIAALATRIRRTKTKAVFIAIHMPEYESAIRQCETFVDRVLIEK